MRFQGARFLLMLQRDKEEHLKMAAGLCDALLALDRSMASQKTRYFASSHGHRVKHRLWVGLTIIQVRFNLHLVLQIYDDQRGN